MALVGKFGATVVVTTYDTGADMRRRRDCIRRPRPATSRSCVQQDRSGALDNAQTFTPQHDVLICTPGAQVGLWQRVDGIQRPVETWFTYGPEATLTADDILPATSWVSVPAKVDVVCTVVQTPAGGGPPVTRANDTGHFVDFPLIPNLATLKLSGYCNWRKAWQRVPG
jgi:hypothetical protein